MIRFGLWLRIAWPESPEAAFKTADRVATWTIFLSLPIEGFTVVWLRVSAMIAAVMGLYALVTWRMRDG